MAQLQAVKTNSFQNVKCDVCIRKELRATVALSGDYDIGAKIDCDFGVPGDCSPGTEAGHCSQTSYTL